MEKIVKILLLEDNPHDAELIRHQISKNNIKYQFKHVSKYDDFSKAIDEYVPDIILSDYNLLGFTGIDALELAKQKCPLTPFIIVTGTINEETAAETIKNGAWDYVVKERLTRLSSAMKNALELKDEKEKRAIDRKKLRISEERYKLAIEGSQDGIWDWDLKTDKMYFSLQWKSMLGYEDHEITNNYKSWEELLHPDDKEFTYAALNKHLKKITPLYHIETRLRCKDGSYKWVFTRGKAIYDQNGNPYRIAGSHTDISERKLMEEKLIKAKEKAEESDRLKTAFIQNMSHEIRTPLNAVLGFSELLIKGNITTKEKITFSNYIRLNGESLAKIIDDIIDISKLQSKQLSIKKFDFNLHALFKELNNYYRRLLIKKAKNNIKLELELPDSVDANFYINTDEQRLKQILNNLISNAIKFTEKGQITFGYKQVENKLYFFVKDTGFGIAQKNISQVFDRFMQFSPQYVSKNEGTGLGLSICKNLVTLLGGELQVESKEKEGSLFFFQIPLIKAESPAKNTEDVTTELHEDLSKYKILIADDEDSNYVLTKRVLKPSKVTIDWAENGQQAVEMAINNQYDLILMDIKMPEMDGIEATKLIKKHNAKIPIIIQTAFAMKEVKDKALDAGCNGFIVKPIALDAFLELVNKHIKQ